MAESDIKLNKCSRLIRAGAEVGKRSAQKDMPLDVPSPRRFLVINGEGGVSKSFFATNFVLLLKDRTIAHRAIDSDHENSTLKRFHPESDFIKLENRREIDRMFIAPETSDLVVIDCRALSTDLFIDFFRRSGRDPKSSARVTRS